MDLKGEIDRNTVIAGDINTPLTSMGRSSRQKINKELVIFNDTLDQMDLIDILEHFIPKQQKLHSFQVHMEHILDRPHVG